MEKEIKKNLQDILNEIYSDEKFKKNQKEDFLILGSSHNIKINLN